VVLKARTPLLAVLAAVALTAGCGGDEQVVGQSPTTATTVEQGIDTTRPPNLGCDYMPDCFPQLAAAALERCPASRLNMRGRTARRRLVKHLERYQSVDLHSSQAYETNGPADDALSDLEDACS
jgi:hypothetical protein